MSIDLTKPPEDVTTDPGSAYRPLFERLQGNILKSHGRNVEKHVFLKFTGAQAAVAGLDQGQGRGPGADRRGAI